MRPVFLIPGLGGSMLIRRVNVDVNISDKKPYQLENRWQNIQIMKSLKHAEQWRKEMALSFDIVSNTNTISGIKNALFNDIDIYDFGGTMGVKQLLPELRDVPSFYKYHLDYICNFQYFDALCNDLYANGYEDHVSLFGVPYDFRLILDPLYRLCLFTQIKNLIEKTDTASVFVCHSLGGVVFKWFLSEFVNQDWIDKYVYKFICVSVPFGGTTEAFVPCLHGYHYFDKFRDLFRVPLSQNTGVVTCFPNRISFHENDPVAKINEKFITLNDYKVLAEAEILPFRIWRDLFESHIDIISSVLNVSVHIIYASCTQTNFIPCFNKKLELTHYHQRVDGDNVIENTSLKSYDKLFVTERLEVTEIQNSKHTGILKHPDFLSIVRSNIT